MSENLKNLGISMRQAGNAVGFQGTAIARNIEISIKDSIIPPYRQKTYFHEKKAVFLFSRAKQREGRFLQRQYLEIRVKENLCWGEEKEERHKPKKQSGGI